MTELEKAFNSMKPNCEKAVFMIGLQKKSREYL